jgi:NitT/TauT family transport system permease protein
MPAALLRLFIRWRRLPLLAATDLLLMAGVVGMVFGLLSLGGEWTHALRPTVDIDLSLRALPRYTFYSLSRGLIAYAFSLAFTLIYGYWAAKDAVAEKLLVPLLDILQSVPVLGFMPGLVLALVAAFPGSNMGLELACVLMIFTGQAWNMTFSYYQSLKSVPPDLREAADAYRFDWRRRLLGVELPYAAMGLVWNSMMSMAGGWFFLTITESFVLGDRDFRLPGIGSYMSAAVGKGDTTAMGWAVLAMSTMIVLLDQLMWRPVVAWAQKFRADDAGARDPARSWFLDLLKRSGVVAFLRGLARRVLPRLPAGAASSAPPPRAPSWGPLAGRACLAVLVVLMGVGLVKLVVLLSRVPARGWAELAVAAGWTLSRVLLSTALGTLWAVPAGLAIGLSPRLSRTLQPVVQVVASFPAPMLFPAAVAVFSALGLGLGWGSVCLMLLGTQWYILFNAVAGGMAIPADLLEAARAYGLTPWQKLTKVYLPASFSFLVTGWVTAAGGAWNASIVAEYVTDQGHVLTANGLGARISVAAEKGDLPSLAAGVVLMSAVVVVFNRSVWRRLYGLAETRFSLTR